MEQPPDPPKRGPKRLTEPEREARTVELQARLERARLAKKRLDEERAQAEAQAQAPVEAPPPPPPRESKDSIRARERAIRERERELKVRELETEARLKALESQIAEAYSGRLRVESTSMYRRAQPEHRPRVQQAFNRAVKNHDAPAMVSFFD